MAQKSTKKAPAKSGPGQTLNIDHEVVVSDGKAPAQALRVMTQEEMIGAEVQKLSPYEVTLANILEEVKDLTVTGPDDKEGYRLVKEAWRKLLTFRTGVENTALAMRRDYTAINKAILSKEAAIVARAKPREEELQKLWKAVDEEKERKEKEEEERLEQQLQARLGELTSAGAKFDDGYYGIGDTVTFDVATLRAMSDEKFQKLLKVVQDKAAELRGQELLRQQQAQQEKEQARKAAKETRGMVLDALGLVPQEDGTLLWTDGVHRLVESEEKLYDLDHYGFTEHVKIIKATIKDFQEAKRQKEQLELDRQKRAARENRDKSRMHALQQAGLQPRGAYLVYEDGFNEPLKLPFDELLDLDDDRAFSDRVVELSNQVGALRAKLVAKQEQDKENAERLRVRTATIIDKMREVGFTFAYVAGRFDFANRLHTATWNIRELLEFSDEDLAAIYQKEAAAIKESQAQVAQLEEEEQEQAEKERLAGLSDDEVWTEYLVSLRAVLRPPVDGYKAKKSHQRQARFYDRLETLIKEFMPASKAEKEVRP